MAGQIGLLCAEAKPIVHELASIPVGWWSPQGKRPPRQDIRRVEGGGEEYVWGIHRIKVERLAEWRV
jgi:hypothetical protein